MSQTPTTPRNHWDIETQWAVNDLNATHNRRNGTAPTDSWITCPNCKWVCGDIEPCTDHKTAS